MVYSTVLTPFNSLHSIALAIPIAKARVINGMRVIQADSCVGMWTIAVHISTPSSLVITLGHKIRRKSARKKQDDPQSTLELWMHLRHRIRNELTVTRIP